MAVYQHTYQPYAGPTTRPWGRCLVLARFSYRRLFQSRFLVLFLAVCGFFPFGCATFIYLKHNSPLLVTLQIRSGALPPVDGRFFFVYAMVQGALALFLTLQVGPTLVAPDLANGGLALLLSRPLSRAEYVAGKLAILGVLLSLVTWVPGLLLCLIQAGSVGGDWLLENLWLIGALVGGSLVWILVLSLLALAISAWVKWRIAAGASLLGVFFVGAGLGQVINEVFDTHVGSLLNIAAAMSAVWGDLFRLKRPPTDLSVIQAWEVLAAVALGCLWLLARRVRAFEVVR